MERLVTVKDMATRYGCSLPTARRYLRQINPHLENPLAAPLWAFNEWERKRTVIAPETSRKRRQEIIKRQQTGRVIVPRTREG